MSVCLWEILDMKNLTCQEYVNARANPEVHKRSPASRATLPCICAHIPSSPLPAPLYGPLCRCDHFRHEVCLHLITVLITDDLSLIEWVCSCTINLKAQWTVRGHRRTKQLCSVYRGSRRFQCDTHLEPYSKAKTVPSLRNYGTVNN